MNSETSTTNSLTLLDEAKVTCDIKNNSEFNELCDIFTTPNVSESLIETENSILKPVSLVKTG